MQRKRQREEDGKPTSELLAELAGRDGGERITLDEIARGTGGREYGLLLLFLALPETIPMIGFSAILATPIFVIGAVMVLKGAPARPPRWIRCRSLPRSRVMGAVERALPLLARLERLSRPRWSRIAEATRLQGMVCLVMAVVLAIPVPGLNIVAAFSVAGLGLGILQRDGLVVSVALVLAVLATAGMAAVAAGAGVLLRELLPG